jgi:hypothetical protein
METVTAQAEIGLDGKLRIEVSCDLPPGRTQAVVVLGDTPSGQQPPFDTLSGILDGIGDPNFDVDAALREMNAHWQRKAESESCSWQSRLRGSALSL